MKSLLDEIKINAKINAPVKNAITYAPNSKYQMPKNDTTTIECPDCSTAINISNTPGIQQVKCPKCKIEGEIEL